jgi:ribonuclease VapC
MVLDSSALVAILLAEPEAARFAGVIARAQDPVVSAVSFVECSIVMSQRSGEEGVERLDRMLRSNGIRRIAIDERQAHAARVAWIRFGREAPPRLTFGACFSYALATTLDRPLLFKGGDFAKTDVTVAS